MAKKEKIPPDELPRAVPVIIEKVVELGGVLHENGYHEITVYAHLTPPKIEQVMDQHTTTGTIRERQFALLAENPSGGIAYLGEIDPQTKRFIPYDTKLGAFYTRSEKNRVIEEMLVPIDILERLVTIDTVLAMPGIVPIRELIPER